MARICFIAWMMIWLLAGCRASGDFLLLGFETDSEFDNIRWQCHTLFFQSQKYPAQGKHSLLMQFYPSSFPGFSLSLSRKNWRQYQALSFNVFNPGNQTIQFGIRIDDLKKEYSEKENFYTHVMLSPGPNEVKIPLDSFTGTGTNRKPNLKTIRKLYFYISQPNKKITLFFDNVRLVL